MVRLKKDKINGGYINRDTGKKVDSKIYIPIIQNFTKLGYLGWINSKRFKLTKKNKLPFSIETIAERLGGSKEDYESARNMVADWLSKRKINLDAGIEFTESFPSP